MISFGLAAAGSKSSLDELQQAIDYLTCKAKARMPFAADDKEFLTDVFESLAMGGKIKGYGEAATLIGHYLKGGGSRLQIDAAVYNTSVIVRDACAALKDYIRERITQKMAFSPVSSADRGFVHSALSKRLGRAVGRDPARQGYLLVSGYLLAEQNNNRLQKANNRFILASQSAKIGSEQILTTWSVDDVYEFEPFERSSYFTEVQLSGVHTLKIPDGLSHYMTTLGLAKAFPYSARWTESWSP